MYGGGRRHGAEEMEIDDGAACDVWEKGNGLCVVFWERWTGLCGVSWERGNGLCVVAAGCGWLWMRRRKPWGTVIWGRPISWGKSIPERGPSIWPVGHLLPVPLM